MIETTKIDRTVQLLDLLRTVVDQKGRVWERAGEDSSRARALQERARDEQTERDGLRGRRAQEQAERDWRKKEAEEARKKAEMEAMLIDTREQQMRQKEHFLAVQAQREWADFEPLLRYM